MMMSQGSEGAELSNETRSMSLMPCVLESMRKESCLLSSAQRDQHSVFPKQVTSRHIAFSVKSMNEKHVL